jgi:hypothetical protein
VRKVHAYDFDIEYVKGENNIVVDTLSKIHASFSVTKISTEWNSMLLVEYSKNTFTCELMEANVQDDRYKVLDYIIHYKYMIYIFPKSTVKDNILRETHDAPLAGNQGYLKTFRHVKERFK